MQISQNSLHYTSNYYQQENDSPTEVDESENSTEDTEPKKNKANDNELSDDEKQLVYKLQARDTEVRAHEAAHQAAGGGMTGGANYSYQRGPDGKMYAIGGEVSISMPGGSDPDELIANAQQVIAAALAPANPSGQDMAVASGARALMIEAEREKAKEAYENQNNDTKKEENETPQNKLNISA